MTSFTDDGLHWNKNNLHFNELGLPYTVPPWDQTFPQNTFKKYTWQQICQMSGLELLQHFTVRFSPVIWRSRSSLRQVTYRCNLVSACRREFSGVVGVQKMIRHIKRHLAKLEEHRILNNYCKHYIENLTFYAVGDKFPTGTMGSNDEIPSHVEAKRDIKSKSWGNGKHKTRTEIVMGNQNMKTAKISYTVVQTKDCKTGHNSPVISGKESLKQDGISANIQDKNLEETSELRSSPGAEEAIHSSFFQISTSSLTMTTESLSSSFGYKTQHEKDHGTEEVTLTPKRDTSTTSGLLTRLTTMTDVSKTSLEGISDLCKKLKDDEAQLINAINKQENMQLDLNENVFPPCVAGFELSSCELTVQNDADGLQQESKNIEYSLGQTDSLGDGSCCSLNGNLTKIATKSIDVLPQDTHQKSFNESNFQCEGSNSPPRMRILDTMDFDVPFIAETYSEVMSSSPSSSNLPNQNIQVSQSKYGELLAVIEEIGKDIRPTYAGSKNASERLKKGIMHARALVRECLIETERCARQ